MNRREEFKTIKERNKWFHSLKPAGKRVEIAKDLIRSIESSHFRADTGYFQTFSATPFNPQADAQKEILKKGVFCAGCAIAGLFYSRIALGGKICFENLLQRERSPDSISAYGTAGQKLIHKKMKRIFSSYQLDLIEAAYEETREYSENLSPKIDEAARWGKKMRKEGNVGPHEDLMIPICKNIIENKGTFKP